MAHLGKGQKQQQMGRIRARNRKSGLGAAKQQFFQDTADLTASV
jgi:hypothetical protein